MTNPEAHTDWGDHTPGPWHLRDDDFGDGGGAQHTIEHEGDWPLIATVFSTVRRPKLEGPECMGPRADADARLLSKAYLIPRLEAAIEMVAQAKVGGHGEFYLYAQFDHIGNARTLLDELRSP